MTALPPHRLARAIPAAVALALCLALARPAHAACDLVDGPAGKVARVLDGYTLELDGGGTVRLAGVLPPLAPGWWDKPEPWPPAEAARAALASLVGGRSVTLEYGGTREDRRARKIAHLFVVRGEQRIWAQGHLLRLGHARAVSFKDNRACQRALQALEAEARAAGRGLWRRRLYAVAAAAEPKVLMGRLQTFQLVQGRVAAVARTRRWTFLNFGADWKSDFTVAVAAGDRRRFAGSDVDLAGLRGRDIRVRGWIERWNGPLIKVTHPEQIELLAAAPGGREGAPHAKNPAPRAPGSGKP